MRTTAELHAGTAPDARPEAETRPFYWSIRRELWEHRSVWLGPIIVAAIVLFATLLGTLGLPKKIRHIESLNYAAESRHSMIVMPFSMAPAPIMLASFLIGLIYALDALYGERRDRSILFWKSLPVSDTTAVLAKAAIPIVVMPAIAFVLCVVVITVLLMGSTVWLVLNGVSPALIWSEVRFLQEPVIMFYGLTAHALWFAPIFCWTLLISAWARRTPSLWLVLPPLAIVAAERMAFQSSRFGHFLRYRVMGAMTHAFDYDNRILDEVSQLTPIRYFLTPNLWLGLFFAAGCLVMAVRLRRKREPI